MRAVLAGTAGDAPPAAGIPALLQADISRSLIPTYRQGMGAGVGKPNALAKEAEV